MRIIIGAAVAALLANAAAAAPPAGESRAIFSFAGKRPTFEEQYVKPEVVFSGVQTEGRYSLISEVWTPQFQVPPHFHSRHAETFFVISGQVEWTVDGRAQVLGAGDAVYIPPGAVHSVRVVGGKDMHTLMLSEPGGFEETAAIGMSLTPEEMKNPKVAAAARFLGDFTPAEHPKPKKD